MERTATWVWDFTLYLFTVRPLQLPVEWQKMQGSSGRDRRHRYLFQWEKQLSPQRKRRSSRFWSQMWITGNTESELSKHRVPMRYQSNSNRTSRGISWPTFQIHQWVLQVDGLQQSSLSALVGANKRSIHAFQKTYPMGTNGGISHTNEWLLRGLKMPPNWFWTCNIPIFPLQCSGSQLVL